MGASTKTRTERLAKDHTRRHAKDLADGNVRIKTLTGNRSKEGIGADESRCGGPEDSPMSEDELPANSSTRSHLSAHTKSFGQSNSSLEKGLEDDLNLSDSSEEGKEVAARQH